MPALGCTEPIAIAFAAATARKELGFFPQKISVQCSGNIIKNVKGVVVPNSHGMKGIDVAAVLGTVGGKADQNLAVLQGISEEDIAKTTELLKTDYCTCSLAENVPNLYIYLTAESNNHRAEVEIKYRHIQITKIIKDGVVTFETDGEQDVVSDNNDPRDSLSVQNIIDFASTVDINLIKPILQRQYEYNLAIANEGLQGNYGAAVGKTIIESYTNNVSARARAFAAAGSDARMNGCSLPVIINSGSGNQGMTVSLPVIQYAKEWNTGE